MSEIDARVFKVRYMQGIFNQVICKLNHDCHFIYTVKPVAMGGIAMDGRKIDIIKRAIKI